MSQTRLSVPPSPTWFEMPEHLVGALPLAFRWGALVGQFTNYPNHSEQSDLETVEIAREEFDEATEYWNSQCRHAFPCPCGRQTLSKRQRKQKLGVPFHRSLCGQSELEHEVNLKRNSYDSEQISDWYFNYDSESDEDDEIFESMQLRRSDSGNLRFNEDYDDFLKQGVLNQIMV